MKKELSQIIKSPTENDMYKFSMGQCVAHQFPSYEVEWTFKCRNAGVKFTPEMVNAIRRQIDLYCGIRYSDEELDYLASIPWIKPDFVSRLRRWFPRREEIMVNEGDATPSECGLSIKAKGTWFDTMWYEVPILAIVNEVYFAYTYGIGAKNIEFQKKTIEKFEKMFNHDVWEHIVDNEDDECPRFAKKPSEEYCEEHPYNIGTFSEFGLRRRYSSEMQDWLVNYLVSEKVPGFVGTSNVYLAKKYGVKPVGTMAHEFAMCVGQGNRRLNPAYSNWAMMDAWIKEYGTMNGIALTDTIGTGMFLKDFRTTFARVFDGVRHDSGDPVVWANMMIDHYRKLGIDPSTKTLLFSDSLDFEKATRIKESVDGANVAFGIGTYLTNPLDNPLNIVMKVTKCNGSPVAKISDTPGKGLCKDRSYIEWLGACIDRRMSAES